LSGGCDCHTISPPSWCKACILTGCYRFASIACMLETMHPLCSHTSTDSRKAPFLPLYAPKLKGRCTDAWQLQAACSAGAPVGHLQKHRRPV
jgi:hypothetical protein